MNKMSGRDPFFSPKVENEFNFSGYRPEQSKRFRKPTHMAQSEEPWSRLHDAATSASMRRSDLHNQRQAPKDSLDFQLSSAYNHHKDVFFNKNQALYQRETVSEDRRERENKNAEEEDAGVVVWVDPERRSVHSIK